MKKQFIFIVLLSMSLVAFAQDKITVSGTVYGAEGEPLLIADVYEKETLNGVSTDFEGNYQIQTKPNATLIVSYLGYVTKEIKLGGQSRILDITLEEDSQLLNEVVVVGFETVAGQARKRRENIQKIAEPITIVSSNDIEATGTNNIETVALRVPNMSFNDYQDANTFTVNVRGITQIRFFGEAPVSIVIDDVQLPFYQQLNQDFFDIEQVEVVKGPQGTLYGKNAIGGAINIITKQPTNKFEGLVKAGYGRGENMNFTGAVSGPIVKDRVFFRLGGTYSDFGGFPELKNTFLNKQPDFKENISARGQLKFRVTPRFNIDLKTQYIDTNSGALYYIDANAEGDNPSAANVFKGNPEANILGESDLNSMDYSGKLSYKSNFGKFLSITNYSKMEYETTGDFDHTSAPMFWQSTTATIEGFNQELRFVSDFKGKLSMVAGAFYQKNNRDEHIRGGSDTGTGTIDFSTAFTNIFNNVDSENLAGFGNLEYKITDKFAVTAGLRYDHDRKQQEDKPNNKINTKTFEQFQPKVGLSFQVSDNALVFANYAEGFRTGGFNPVTGGANARFFETFDKEVTKNVEVGYKSSWWNNRIILNANLFRTEFENEQVYVVDLNSSFALGVFNLEDVVNFGSELEFKIRPVKNLDLGVSYGYTDSRIRKADIAERFPAFKGAPATSGGGDWVGNKSPFISKHNLLVSALYKVNINDDNSVSIYADYVNNGKFYWHPDNFDVQDPYDLVNFKVSYNYKGAQLGVYGNNILNNTNYNAEFYANEFSGAVPGDLRFPGRPQDFGVELSYKF